MRFSISTILLFANTVFFYSCGLNTEISDSIQLKQFNYPVLKGKANAPVLRIGLEIESEMDTCRQIRVSLEGTRVSAVDEIRIFYTGLDSLFRDRDYQFGETQIPAQFVNIGGKQRLKKGLNYFWVCYQLSEKIDLGERVDAGVQYVQINNDKLAPEIQSPEGNLQVGVAVRKHMDDKVHTYRIPGFTTSNKGTLLGVYDVRRESGRDLQGDIDIGLSRSTDGGNSWEPMCIPMDMGPWGDLSEKFNGISDACILVDKNSDDIYLAGLWMYGVINEDGVWVEGLKEESKEWNHQWRNKGSQPGFGVKETSQFLIVKSSDDGQTWGKPVNLTRMCKKEEWWLWAPAPGSGITLKDGTLVFPTQGRDETGLPFSNITYSKDGGETWKTSHPATHNTTENAVVQLSDGSIMLNIRDNRNREEKGDRNGRAIAVTRDLGETWLEHPTSHGALVEPVCMGSLYKHAYQTAQGQEKSVLLFSNPNSKYQRENLTIKISFDDGNTWPEEYWTELDEGRSRGYSCITSIDNDHIGILYEGSQADMTFQKIALEELLGVK